MEENIDSMYKEMVDIAGSDLVSRIMNLFENHRDLAVYWFFKPKFSLGNKSPADYCKLGREKKEEVKRYVGRLEHSVYL